MKKIFVPFIALILLALCISGVQAEQKSFIPFDLDINVLPVDSGYDYQLFIGYYACTPGLTTMFQKSLTIELEINEVQMPEQDFFWTPLETYGPSPGCMAAPLGDYQYLTYVIYPLGVLDPGTYVIHSIGSLDHKITDGFDFNPQDGKLDFYEGVLWDTTFTLTVY